MQPGSSGRDVDIRRQEAVGVTDDAKLKSSCATRASPALAHGADEGYSVVKEPSVTTTSGNEDDSLAASALQTAATMVASADDRSSTKNSYHSVRSLKHKNDRSYKYGTGSADLHRASSLQDLNDGGGSTVERSHRPLTESKVSCGVVESDTASGVCHLHGLLPLPSDACYTNPACTRYNRSLTTDVDEQSLPPSRSRCRTRRAATNLQLELVGHTGFVSNTAQFWEDLVLDSSSAASWCGTRPRHMSEDRHRLMRRDASSPRYLTIGVPYDVLCASRTTSDALSLSRSESLHENDNLEVCFCILSYSLTIHYVACLCAMRMFGLL